MEPTVKKFSIGDKVVYPGQGVGEITGIEHQEVAGQRQSFYILKIMKSGTKIMIPLTKLRTANLREIVDAQTVKAVYAVLKEKGMCVDATTWNRRFREYMEKIKSGDILKLAAVMRDLSRLKIDKDLSFGERKMLDTVSDLLVTELSLAKKCTEEEINAELKKIFVRGKSAAAAEAASQDRDEDDEESEEESDADEDDS